MGNSKNNGFSFLKILLLVFFVIIILLICYIISLKYKKDDFSSNDSMLLDLSKVSDYVNYDGTYASMKQVSFYDEYGRIHNINLGMDGKVFSGNYALREDITNVSAAIDIVAMESDSGMLEDSSCYILTDNGDVYVYSMANLMDNIYEAELLDDVNNVSRLIGVNYAYEEDASSSFGIIAILFNGDYVRIA